MASNFDFLKNIDKELFSIIQNAEKLFRDEYFNQCSVELRIFAEKLAKKVYNASTKDMTFDDVINCIKDNIQTEREREFVEDLFFIKRMGNKCAHGEDATVSETLETIRRAFEVAIYYSFLKKKDDKIDKLQFDETLLVMQKKNKETKLVDEYVRLAMEQKEELLNSKQGEFNSKTEKQIDGHKDETYVTDASQYKKNNKKTKKKKELTLTQQKIKSKVKDAKKVLREKINNKPKKESTKKTSNSKKKVRKNASIEKFILFIIFVTISIFFLTKMIFFF